MTRGMRVMLIRLFPLPPSIYLFRHTETFQNKTEYIFICHDWMKYKTLTKWFNRHMWIIAMVVLCHFDCRIEPIDL